MKFGILALGIILILGCGIFLYITPPIQWNNPDNPTLSAYIGFAIGLLLLIEGSIKERQPEVKG